MPAMPPAAAGLVRRYGLNGLVHVARWLMVTGRELWQENLTAEEREEFKALLARSKGRRRNLTSEEVTRLSRLVVKTLVGKDGLDLGDLVSIARKMK